MTVPIAPAELHEDLAHALRMLASGTDLDRGAAAAAMDVVMLGEASPAQIAALLMGLAVKGETVEELAGIAATMRAHAVPVPLAPGSHIVDTCGTGGDGADTFNVSTTAAFVVAACGVRVAKHGNRAVSSACGSADVLEALGANIDADPEKVAQLIESVGFAFMFAPRYHPAMRHAAIARRELRLRTAFNLLGPITNPAGARHQIVGVSDGAAVPKIAKVLRELGAEHALVVRGRDGLDELSICAPTVIHELAGGRVSTYELAPEDVGLTTADVRELRGGDAVENARITRGVLDGSLDGACREVVLLNAGAALYVGGVVADIAAGVERARAAILDGAAITCLDSFVRASHQAHQSVGIGGGA